MDEEKYWICFACCPGIGPKTFARLLHSFGSAKEAWLATEKQFHEAGLSEVLIKLLREFRDHFSIDAYNAKLANKKIAVVTQLHGYPTLLFSLARPPLVLFVAGNAELLHDALTIAVVGTRKITSYGQTVTAMLTSDLVGSGTVIVSGLALGVDAAAHRACLHAGGKTIAVLGSGVDYATPRENQLLYDQILKNGGCIVSEYPLGQVPHKGSFPARNRIIAGLSRGVLVTEGAQDSGSLITAREAQKIDRPVFAVPGPITSSVSHGPNVLIAQGAHVVNNAGDILSVLGEEVRRKSAKKRLHTASVQENTIIEALQNDTLSFDELVRKTHFDATVIGGILTLMEMKSMIRINEAGLFSLH